MHFLFGFLTTTSSSTGFTSSDFAGDFLGTLSASASLQDLTLSLRGAASTGILTESDGDFYGESLELSTLDFMSSVFVTFGVSVSETVVSGFSPSKDAFASFSFSIDFIELL